MAVSITSRPSKLIYSGSPSSVTSRYTCACHPIVYGFNFTIVPDAGYRIIVSIYESGSNTLLGMRSFRPLSTGINKLDISRFIKPYLESSFDCDFSQINQAEQDTILRFYITYQEAFSDGTFGSLITDASNYISAILSTKQIGEQYGQNMADYVPFGIEQAGYAKFLTEFEQPVLFKGWPFSLSFVYSSEIGGHEIKRIQEKRDVNGDLISDDETQLIRTEINNINHLLVVPSDSRYVDVYLESGEAVPESYVYAGYVEDGYTEDL